MIPYYLVWLHRLQDLHPSSVGLSPRHGIPPSFKQQPIIEFALFHLLVALTDAPHSSYHYDNHISNTDALITRYKLHRKSDANTLDDLLHSLNKQLSPVKRELALKSLSIIYSSTKSSSTINNVEIARWIRCIQAESVSDACTNLSGAMNVPACVAADILLRTPMSKHELILQLSVWSTYLGDIAKAYHQKTSHLTKVFTNMVYYCIHYSPVDLQSLVQTTLSFFSSTKAGYKFNFVNNDFLNSFLWKSSVDYLQLSTPNHIANMGVIRAQEVVVKHLTHANLSHQGYMAIALSLRGVSPEKASKIFKCAVDLFPNETASVHRHVAEIYLATTPELLLHSFDTATANHGLSSIVWYVLVRKLEELHLLTRHRALKVLDELLSRRSNVILSKPLIIALLQHVKSIPALERFVAKLDLAELLDLFSSTINTRYLYLLYHSPQSVASTQTPTRPYIDSIAPGDSDLERARRLYESMDHKAVSTVGTMLNGELRHQPEKLFDLYQKELSGRSPDESCLCALLRVVKRDRRLMWGEMFASQIAVHQFRSNVRSTPELCNVVPSDRAWYLYVEVLALCYYTAELAELLKWWEDLQFAPSKDTLMLLLRSLPVPFAERHVRHWCSLPAGSSFVLTWPWPTVEEFTGANELKDKEKLR